MKKIAFFVQQMLCGGVENALISLSGKLRDEGHQVTIYVIQKTGAFIDKVPDGVQLRQIPMDERLRRSIPVGGNGGFPVLSVQDHMNVAITKHVFLPTDSPLPDLAGEKIFT